MKFTSPACRRSTELMTCVCCFRAAHDMLAACMKSLHGSPAWLQLLSDPHLSVSAATPVCLALQTYSPAMFNKQRAPGDNLADRDPEQTFEKPSQESVFGIVPRVSSPITAAIRLHLWLLSSNTLFSDKTEGKFNQCADLFIKLVHRPGKAVCLSSETQRPCDQWSVSLFLMQMHSACKGELLMMWAGINMADCTLGSAPRRLTRHSGVTFNGKVLILAPAARDLRADK